MKKHTKKLLFLSGAAIAGIYGYNKFVEATATQNNLLSKDNGELYHWKDYDIFYTKTGVGSPILLIHDTDPLASSIEYHKMIQLLSKTHTVYALDLIGCGRSDKPSIEYTTYFYVQMLSAFVKEVIPEKPVVVASNKSTSFTIMTAYMDENLFKKIILINPVSLDELNTIPDENSKLKKNIMQLPFIGTFIYNLYTSPIKVDEIFRTKYDTNPKVLTTRLEDAYYESAHTSEGNGRYLYSSIVGNYINNNINHALKKLKTELLIIANNYKNNNAQVLNDYHKMNKTINIIRLSDESLYPHMDRPEKISKIIENRI